MERNRLRSKAVERKAHARHKLAAVQGHAEGNVCYVEARLPPARRAVLRRVLWPARRPGHPPRARGGAQPRRLPQRDEEHAPTVSLRPLLPCSCLPGPSSVRPRAGALQQEVLSERMVGAMPGAGGLGGRCAHTHTHTHTHTARAVSGSDPRERS
eukprot:1981706-Rhodomonas_salina.1